MSWMEKRIITWHGGSIKSEPWTFSRGFIFGNYGDNFAHYCELVREAKKDFPNLKDEDITVAVVRESSYMKNFIYISFLLKPNQKHKSYADWKRFDFN